MAEMKRKHKLFWVGYTALLILCVALTFAFNPGTIRSLVGSIIFISSLLLVGLAFKKWFDEWYDKEAGDD